MHGLILCSGYGKRLGKLTKNTPKPMIKVGGKPVVQHLIDLLRKHGVGTIHLSVHYLAEKFAPIIKKNKDIWLWCEMELTGERGLLDDMHHLLTNNDFIVMNGDTLTDLDITEMYLCHRLARSHVTRAMDYDTYTGTKIISWKNVWRGKELCYQVGDTYWQDMGTKSGLRKARRHYKG